MSQRTRVGIIRGGPSSEYDVSLKTGAAVLGALNRDRYDVHDLFIDRTGTWHSRGKPVEPDRAIRQLDVAFLGLHGTYGEDGQIQRLLERHRIPFTGSGSLASSVAMNKAMTKHVLRDAGIRMPAHRTVSWDDLSPQLALELFRTFPQPSVIKPLNSGSSVGVSIARTYDEFLEGLELGFTTCDQLLLEEYVKGTEATVGILESFRDDPYYAMPEVEIRPAAHKTFFDWEAKYDGAVKEICPGTFPLATKNELARLARLVHRTLNLAHYSRADFIVTPRGPYFLEVNTLPGLTESSLLPQSVSSVGIPFPVFLDHLITLARAPRRA